ncbi:MAG: transmembrane sensor [Polaribacter sp.]|jgi:transmembrane sensor
MTNIQSLHQRRALKQKNRETSNKRMDEACDWITKIDRKLSRREVNSLRNWLQLDKNNLTQFMEVAKIWDKSLELNRLADIFPQETISQKPISNWAKSIAASFVLVISISLVQVMDNLTTGTKQLAVVETDSNRILETKIGESHQYKLSDGSEIVLNTGTLAEVHFTPELRSIDLKKGEIHIDVAHDKSRPLQVKVGDKIIQAVGTAFNIQVKDQLIELIVTDGEVIVKEILSLSFSDIQKSETDLNIINTTLTMTTKPINDTLMSVSKGEKIDLSMQGIVKEKVIKVQPIEIVASLSWRQGNLVFRGESLQEAMDEISRYSNIHIQLDNDPKLEKIQIAGMFKTGDIDGLLGMLKTNFDIDYEHKANDTIYLKLASIN